MSNNLKKAKILEYGLKNANLIALLATRARSIRRVNHQQFPALLRKTGG